jgi:hypothetical protein
MESTAPSAAAEQLPARTTDAAAGERLDRNLTPAIADAGEAAGFLRYALAAVASALVVLAAVLALNVLVDPFSLAGTKLLPPALENDRTTKLDLIDALTANPQLVVLGSSRSRQAEPAYLRKLTGKSGFNAGVTGGSAADAWAMVRRIDARFPGAERNYIWFVDYGIATNGINPQLAEDPRAAPYLGRTRSGFSLADVGTYLGFDATKASFRVLRACAEGRCHGRIRYHADGSLTAASQRYLPERAKSLAKSVAEKLREIRHQPRRAPRLSPRRLVWFERALRWMNAHGATPVIVLNPIYPSVWRLVRQRGAERPKQALATLHRLQRRFRFVVVDCEDVSRWGGKAQDFNNATHVNRRNMRRLLRYVVAHSHGVLG